MKITSAKITHEKMSQSSIDITINGDEFRLFSYFRDEASFTEEELLGLTYREAQELKAEKLKR